MDQRPYTRVDVLRHGEIQGGPRYCGATDVPLSAEGWRTLWTAVHAKEHWDTIIASPLARCADFARALARRRSLPLRVDARLRELDFGAWEGRDASRILETGADALARFWRDPWHHSPPDGESLRCLRDRVLAAWHDAVAQRQRLLLITHGGPVRVILQHVRRLAPEALMQIDVPYGAFYSFLVDNQAATCEADR